MTVPLAHKHLIIRAEVEKPPLVENEVIEWMGELIHDIKMRPLLGPYAVYSNMEGNRGITAIAAINTSSITLHTWDEVFPALLQLDVYTCSDLTPEMVVPWLSEFLPRLIQYQFIDREHGLETICTGSSAHDWEDILSKPHQYPRAIWDQISDRLLARNKG